MKKIQKKEEKNIERRIKEILNIPSFGYFVNSPKEAIKQAFQSDIIKDGHAWIDALNDRKLTTHTYEEETAIIVTEKNKENYFPLLKNLHLYFQSRI